jgi:hypothetical protein
MKTNNNPNWIVPLELSRKLKEIGMDNSEIDGSYGWCRDNEMYDYDNDGDFIIYTALDASNWKNPVLEPTFTWEQVLEWFRGKNIVGWVECQCNPEMEYYTRMLKDGENYYIKGKRKHYSSYEEAHYVLIEELIITYKKYYGNSI